MTPREYILSLNKPIITIPECSAAMDVGYIALYQRLRAIPEGERPEAHGAFRAGGYLCFTRDSAIDWCEHHLQYWAERQADRKVRVPR